MTKKIALLGATGQTGSIVLEKALEQGYAVKALVRNINKLSVSIPATTFPFYEVSID